MKGKTSFGMSAREKGRTLCGRDGRVITRKIFGLCTERGKTQHWGIKGLIDANREAVGGNLSSIAGSPMFHVVFRVGIFSPVERRTSSTHAQVRTSALNNGFWGRS